jgi:hypothetical protein
MVVVDLIVSHAALQTGRDIHLHLHVAQADVDGSKESCIEGL